MPTTVGSSFPNVELRRQTPSGIQSLFTDDLLADKVVVLFGVPGAFTPTCQDVHLPGFLSRSDELEAAGVDEVACVAVNDAFVMGAWAKATGAEGRITFLADGNGALAEALGLELDGTSFGMGKRVRRFAAVVRNGVIEYLEPERGRGVGASGAEAVLSFLRSS